MRVGVVKELKPGERRIALAPAGAQELARDGHDVLVEFGAGVGSGFEDAAYVKAGARLVTTREAWESSELLLKVKEPVEPEYGLLRKDLVLFTYLHLAPNPGLIDALVGSGITAIAYETVEDAGGGLPLLTPMSEIAGRLATQAGAYFLQGPQGGGGVLIGGAPGVRPARVLVVGGGAVGAEAAHVAVGMRADVTILERSLPRIRALEAAFETRARVLMSDSCTLEAELACADLVVGAVLMHGEVAPCLIGGEQLSRMRSNAVIVDVAIDQGGCVETSRPTTHDAPVYSVDDVLHYCVANMPAAVPQTATCALTNATLPYVRRLAGSGIDAALAADRGFAQGVNIRSGEIPYRPVAQAYAAAEPAAV